MLNVFNLHCERGDQRLLAGLSFELAAGAALHVRGPNGCGKSTLLKILSGLLTPMAGYWQWQQHVVDKLSGYWQAFHYVGHQTALRSTCTSLENVRFMAALQQSSVDVTTLIERSGLRHQTHELAGRLSFGQQRRLALVRLLLTPKKLWLLDEPFTGLDNASLNYLCELMCEHVQAGGMLIFTSHQVPDLDMPLSQVVLGA